MKHRTTATDYRNLPRGLFGEQHRYPQVGLDNAAVDIKTVPTREDLLRIINGESVRDKALYTVLWGSGCRVTALAALKIKHWAPKDDSYGITQAPGAYVERLKRANLPATVRLLELASPLVQDS